MVRVIMDDTGSGKTKQLIDLANAAVKTEHGNVICIEPKSELTYDIDYNIRLIAANDYELPSYEAFKGFLSGMYAGNYDITHVFVDNLTTIIRDNNETQVERFLDWLDAFSEKNRIKFTISHAAIIIVPPHRNSIQDIHIILGMPRGSAWLSRLSYEHQ